MADHGSDWQGVTDITPDLLEVTGRQCLGEALATRLYQPAGGVFYDQTNGFDTRSLLSSEMRRDTRKRVYDQLVADERVEAADVELIQNELTRETLIKCTVFDADGPFLLVLKPADLSYAILDVE